MNSPLRFVLSASAVWGCAATASPDVPEASASSAADLTGTWSFDLASSDAAGLLRERCAARSGGDAATASACWGKLAAEAAREKIRFSAPSTGGSVVWTSFSQDGGGEVVFLQVPLRIVADGPGRLLGTVAGAPTGPQAERFTASAPNATRIELVDGRTIALVDPQKGRLVYVRI